MLSEASNPPRLSSLPSPPSHLFCILLCPTFQARLGSQFKSLRAPRFPISPLKAEPELEQPTELLPSIPIISSYHIGTRPTSLETRRYIPNPLLGRSKYIYYGCNQGNLEAGQWPRLSKEGRRGHDRVHWQPLR